MNKQIISLMCIAIVLALALVVANEKWPDGYRTAPQMSMDNAPLGAVATGPVFLPKDTPAEKNHAQNAEKNAGSSSASAQKKDTSPQGELVAIDSGTLRNDASSTQTTSSAQSSSSEKKPTQNQEKQSTSEKQPTQEKQKQTANKPNDSAKSGTQAATKKEATPPPASGLLGKATPKILLYTHEAVLEIKATGPIRCKTFKLVSPDRLVVDLIGKWTVPVPTVPSNTIIQRVRVGEAPERTRIVLDLKRALKVDKIVQVNASTINIRMQ